MIRYEIVSEMAASCAMIRYEKLILYSKDLNQKSFRLQKGPLAIIQNGLKNNLKDLHNKVNFIDPPKGLDK